MAKSANNLAVNFALSKCEFICNIFQYIGS